MNYNAIKLVSMKTEEVILCTSGTTIANDTPLQDWHICLQRVDIEHYEALIPKPIRFANVDKMYEWIDNEPE